MMVMRMKKLTERDRKCYEFLVKTKLPANSYDLAKLFYPSPTGNERSSVVVAQRRLKVLHELQYVEISKRKFGESIYYYVGKINERSLRHGLLITHTIATIATSGFEILDIQTEKKLPEKYGIVCDVFLMVRYNKTIFYLILEVDLTKEFNETGYTKLITDLKNKSFILNYPVLILSISDFPLQSDLIKKNVTQIKTNFTNVNALLFNFIK